MKKGSEIVLIFINCVNFADKYLPLHINQTAMRLNTRIFLLLLLLLASDCLASPKREMRAVWVATVWGIDWPSVRGTDRATAEKQKKELCRLLDRVESLNFTTVYFQVRGMGDVMYSSRLEPWSSFLTGRRGADPGWDPLETAVRECHARGLECYAWVNPFRWSTGTDYDTPQDRQWKEKGWLLRHGKYTVFNPGLEEARAHIVDICREIVEGYDVDGLVFDDYFYPNRIPADKTAPDYELYLAEAPWMTFGDWRRACVHKAVADVSAMIADTRPGCRFGISPAGVAGKHDTSARKWGVEPCRVKAADWQYEEIYSDPLGLMYQGTVDFISPQIYWPTTHSTAPYAALAGWWSMASCHFGSHLYSSLTLERIEKGNLRENILDVGRQIDHNRGLSIDGNLGVAVYSARFLPLVEGMLRQKFSLPALSPELRHRPGDVPEAPRRVSLGRRHLEWEGVKGEPGEVMRYTVYIVPPGISREEAMAENGDGIDGGYLHGVVYGTDTDLPECPEGANIAVCTLDGRSAESQPAWVRQRQ